MAALTTTRDGVFENVTGGVTPWTALTGAGTGGIPGVGDTFIATNLLTQGANEIVGHSPGASDATAAVRFNAGGSQIIGVGLSLTVHGDVLKGANNATSITMEAGSTFQFDAHLAADPPTAVYRYYSNDARTGLYFQCNGTSGSHCTITSVKTNSAASARIIVTNDLEGQIVATYTDISYLGSASVIAWEFALSASGTQFDLTDCTFDNCGTIGHPYNAVDGSVFNLKRVKFTNSLDTSFSPPASLAVRFTAVKTSGTRSIDLCSFDKALYGSGFYSLSVTNSALLNGCSSDAAATTTTGTFSGNFIDHNSAEASIPFQTIANCYHAFRTNQSHGITPPNYGSAISVTGCVFEIPQCVNSTDNGDLILLAGNPGSALTATIQNNLLLPIATGSQAGKCPGTLVSEVSAGGGPNWTLVCEHNTYTVEKDGVSGAITGFRVSENSAFHAGGVSSFKSNLAWASASSATLQWMFADMDGTPNTDVLASANSVKNAGWNLSPASGTNAATGYKGVWSTAPGTTDLTLTGNPFVDSTRNCLTWAVAQGQAGTLAALKTYLAADPSRIATMYSWVRDGWKVTGDQGLTLKDAGHDFATIGALGYVAASGGRGMGSSYGHRLLRP